MKDAQKRLLFAGGDLRQITAAAELGTFCSVTVTGFDRFGVLPEHLTVSEHIQDLPQMLDALVLPMPVSQDGCFLYTPFGSSALRLSALLPLVRPDGIVLGGRFSPQIRSQIESAGLRAADYAAEETFALRNAVPTAEGAIQIAMQELPVVLYKLPCLILGAGRVSRALQSRLLALGADVTVAARRCTDLARSKGDVRKPLQRKKSVPPYSSRDTDICCILIHSYRMPRAFSSARSGASLPIGKRLADASLMIVTDAPVWTAPFAVAAILPVSSIPQIAISV